MPDSTCDVVVVGASAGGVEALRALARALPSDFAVPVLVVLHVPSAGISLLPDILARAGPLEAVHATDGETPRAGHIYVAPPNWHMVLDRGTIRLTNGPRENGHRPAIDPLFVSAARAYDGRTAGVVLSGTLDDGTVGLFTIKEGGGATLVQDPEEALYPSMPRNAIAYAQPDYVQTVSALADTLVRLTGVRNGKGPTDVPMPNPAPSPSAEDAQPGTLAPFSCPECSGTLWEVTEGGIATYRCRVGHAYTASTLVERHADTVERALWTAYRALEEKAAMSTRVARRLTDHGRTESADRFERQADMASRQADDLRTILSDLEPPPDPQIQVVPALD